LPDFPEEPPLLPDLPEEEEVESSSSAAGQPDQYQYPSGLLLLEEEPLPYLDCLDLDCLDPDLPLLPEEELEDEEGAQYQWPGWPHPGV